jgi:hypothetical protein
MQSRADGCCNTVIARCTHGSLVACTPAKGSLWATGGLLRLRRSIYAFHTALAESAHRPMDLAVKTKRTCVL